jgi:zinc D-Ala-D-Ala dipeptidase
MLGVIKGSVAIPRETCDGSAQLVDLDSLDPTIKLSIRYATTQNFLGQRVYDQARALLQLPVAKAVVAAHRELKSSGYGLLVFDAYRPWSVTKIFWDLTPDSKRGFVANPTNGSVHNRGCAVDVGMYRLSDNSEVQMPSSFDEMSYESAASYQGGSEEERYHRDRLRVTMERHGFSVHPSEWWHFDHRVWPDYPILDVPFCRIPRRAQKT